MASRLKELRKEKNETLVDIEKKTGIKRSTYSDYENGIIETGKLATWKKLADHFGVTIPYIMGVQNSKHVDSDTDIFTNIDQSPDMMQQAKFADTRQAALVFNRVLFWLDNDILDESTVKPKKSEDVHNIDKELISLINNTFQSMMSDLLYGIGFTISNPQKYLEGIEYYKRNFIMMQKFSKLNNDDRTELLLHLKELEIKAQNKKASDD